MHYDHADQIRLIQGDITKIECDCFLASTNIHLNPPGSLDQAVRNAASDPDFAEKLHQQVLRHKRGKAWLMSLDGKGARPVIYTHTPRWDAGLWNEDRYLRRCYRNALRIASDQGFKRLAIPLFGTGKHEYPDHRAIRLGYIEIKKQVKKFEQIQMVAHTKDMYAIAKDFFESL